MAGQLFLISPARGTISDRQERQRAYSQDLAEELGFKVFNLRSTLVASFQEPSRKIEILDPWFALDLYEGVHVERSMVIALGSPRVMRNYASGPSTSNSAAVANFVRYKAFVATPGTNATEETIRADFAGFAEWCAVIGLESERDHRSIPFHSFSPFADVVSLDTGDGIRRFEMIHGKAGSLRDHKRRRWERAGELHGRREMVIAGLTLHSGSHWDVQAVDLATKLYAPHQVWKIPKYSYVNVYPDGYVRRPQSSASGADIVQQAPKPMEIVQREAEAALEKAMQRPKGKVRRGRTKPEKKRPGRRR